MHTHILAQFLRTIPQSNYDFQTLRDLSPTEEWMPILLGYSLSLHTLGVIELQMTDETGGTRIRAQSQIAKYLLNSLAEFIIHEQPIINNWETRGIQKNQEGDMLRGIDLLHSMEQARIHFQPNPPPTRVVFVGQVIIKQGQAHDPRSKVLFQYDESANRYQLIGGRKSEADTNMLTTIIREIEEELPASSLKYGVNYRLEVLIEDLQLATLSPTFGAITEYHFWIYHLIGLQTDLLLGQTDRWVSVTDLSKNEPNENELSSHSELLQQIVAKIPGGILGLPSSFQ